MRDNIMEQFMPQPSDRRATTNPQRESALHALTRLAREPIDKDMFKAATERMHSLAVKEQWASLVVAGCHDSKIDALAAIDVLKESGRVKEIREIRDFRARSSADGDRYYSIVCGDIVNYAIAQLLTPPRKG